MRTLNEMFIDRLSNDKSYTNRAALEYVQDRLRYVSPETKDLKVEFDRSADVITLQISGVKNKEIKVGKRSWTTMEMLAFPKPITHYIEDTLKDVFEVPSEGTSVS